MWSSRPRRDNVSYGHAFRLSEYNLKKAAYIAGGLIVVLFGLLLAIPSFLDLNDYKAEIADAVATATGRELSLGGDIDLTLLPAPVLSVTDIGLSSVEGSRQPLLAEIGGLEVRVALLPLLSSQVQVERVTLINPVVWLEKLPSGQLNWEFGPPTEQRDAGGIGSTGASAPGVDLSFDNIRIENGSINFLDSVQGFEESITSINAEVSAASFEGPFDLKGTLVARGIEVKLESAVGQIRESEAVPVRLALTAGGSVLTTKFSGSVSVGTGQASGTLELQGERVMSALQAFDPALASSVQGVAALEHPFQAKAKLFASPGGVEINNAQLQVGSSSANGAVNVLLGEPMRLDVALTLSRLQLEDWLPDQAQNGSAGAASAVDTVVDSGPATPLEFQIPTDIAATVAIGVDALTYREGIVSQVEISGELSEGVIALSRLSALLPGGSSMDIKGDLRSTEELPQFEGQIQARSDNLRGVMGWLGVDTNDVASDRLRKLAFNSIVRATPKLVQIYGVDLRLDSSRLSGGIAYAFRERPAFSIDVVIDQLNLDAYLPQVKTQETKRDTGEVDAAESQATASAQQLIPPDIASALEGIDTNTKVSIATLTYNEVPVKGVEIDVGLLGGALTVRKASVESLAGGSFTLSGNATDLAAKPTINAQLRMMASNVAGLARLAGVDMPISSDRLGSVEISGGLTGRAERLGVDLSVAAAGGNITVRGTVDAVSPKPNLDLALGLKNSSIANITQLFGTGPRESASGISGAVDLRGTATGWLDNLGVDLSTRIGDAELTAAGSISAADTLGYNVALSARHPDATRFVNDLGADYRPAAENLGALDMSADLSGGKSALRVANLKGSFGSASIAGDMDVAFGGPRPRIVGSVNTSEIFVDLFMPRPDPAASQAGGSRGGQRSTASRWSSDPLDLSPLRLADAQLDIAARGIIYGPYTFAEPKLTLSVQDGVLSIDPLVGKLFAGEVDVRGRLLDDEVPALELAVNLSGADLQRAIVDIVGLDAVAGMLGIEGSVSARGRSERELVSALNGTASISATQGVIRGIDLKTLSDRLKRLNEIPDYLALLQTTMNGGETRFSTLGGAVRIENGVMASSDFGGDLEGARLTGQAVVDLPRWIMDLQSEVRLTEHPQAPPLGLVLRGPLDSPQRDVKTQRLERYLAQRVGGTLLQKVLPKEARGIGSVLLGGQPSSQGTERSGTEANEDTSSTQQPQRPEPLTPETLLKGLFKGFGK